MKELPTKNLGENWWGSSENVSDRFKVEFEAMRDLFRKGKVVEIDLPSSNWDVDEMALFTRSLDIKFFGKSKEYSAKWVVEFSIDDGGFLFNPREVFKMEIFYPQDYPFKSPDIAFEKEGRGLVGMGHTFRSKEFEGRELSMICHINHSSSDYLKGHDPAKTNTAMHALRALLWLRSQQEYEKNNRSSMRQY